MLVTITYTNNEYVYIVHMHVVCHFLDFSIASITCGHVGMKSSTCADADLLTHLTVKCHTEEEE